MIPTFDHAEFGLDDLLAAKRATVSVVIPARECEATVGGVVERVRELRGLVDQVLVVDAGSSDATAARAAEAGAEVAQQDDLMPGAGPVLGKGDALWRSLAVASGELIAFVDADTTDFSPGFVTGLVGPLIRDQRVAFVKGTYARPFTVAGGASVDGGGGRVSQLTARPLLEAFYPDLAGLTQPLAGEVAARAELLRSIPFATGYALEMAMLLDVCEVAGVEAMAQCHLGERRNAHQPLDALRPMAATVLAVVRERLQREGRLADSSPRDLVVRPPFATAAAA